MHLLLSLLFTGFSGISNDFMPVMHDKTIIHAAKLRIIIK